jgi:hypothetical protein
MPTSSKPGPQPSKRETYAFRNGGRTVKRQLRPNFTGTELRQRLTAYDRAPFTDLLAEWLELSPSREAVQALAETDPQRFVQALSSLSKMAGFSDKTETSVDITHNYKVLSDSQIEDRLRQLAERTGLPAHQLLARASVAVGEPLAPETLDLEPEPTPKAEAERGSLTAQAPEEPEE